VNNADSSAASQSDWQKIRTDWANEIRTDDGCFDASRRGAVYPMAQTGYAPRLPCFLNIPEFLSGLFLCPYPFRGKLLLLGTNNI
jgi:hypothetical protein